MICSRVQNLIKGGTLGFWYEMKPVYLTSPIDVITQEKNVFLVGTGNLLAEQIHWKAGEMAQGTYFSTRR